jgi:hypothetical protein
MNPPFILSQGSKRPVSKDEASYLEATSLGVGATMMKPAGCVVTVMAAALIACTTGTSSTGTSGGSSGGTTGGTTGGSSSGGTTGGFAAPYTIKPFDRVHISSTNPPNVRQAEAPIDLHDGPFASVQLVVDLESPCYPFIKWLTDQPPPGQSWPADCDAFDRNFEFSIDNPGPDGGPPGLELERAITPFGGPLHLMVDVTDVANGLPGPHQLRVVIPTYSDGAGKLTGSNGGWYVTASFNVTPGPPPHHVLGVVPIFYGDIGAGTIVTGIDFQVPPGTQHGRLYYRVTGHGGAAGDSACDYNAAEEFCRREHKLFVDGQPIADVTPWRTDCAAGCTSAFQPLPDGGFYYCQQNPCGDMNSVRASRANWCPGSETPPLGWSPDVLGVSGTHSVNWSVANIALGGTWRTSLTYIAYGP